MNRAADIDMDGGSLAFSVEVFQMLVIEVVRLDRPNSPLGGYQYQVARADVLLRSALLGVT
jgi:hypothetical protein